MAQVLAATPLSDVETHRAAVRAAPDRPEPRFRLARALYRAGEPAEALDILIGLDAPDAPPAWSFLRGLVHFRLEQWGAAEAAFERALQAEPLQADWAAWRARALQAGGDLEGAAEAFEQAVALRPDRAAFSVLLARAYLGQERFEDALAIVRAAPPEAEGEDPMLPRLRATGPIIRLAQGRKHALQGVLELRASHWRRAVKAFAKALELAPEQTGWRVSRARARLGGGELELARQELEAVVASDPRPPWLALLSAVQQRLGDIGGATASIERAVAADPEGPALRAKLAALRSLSDDPEGALAAWREALRLSPGHAAWRFAYARALLKADQAESAREELKTLTAKGDPPPPWLFLLGSVEAKLGAQGAAASTWRRAIELAGQEAPPSWRSRLAGLLAAQGDEDGAVEALAAAVAHPEATPAMRAQLAHLYWRMAQAPEALSQIERALAEEPDPPFKWRLMADEIRGRLATGASGGSRATSMEYADAFYQNSTVQAAPAAESPYFGFWQAVAARILDSGARRLLDIGCGPGQFAEFILAAAPGVSYTGVDFSAVAIGQAQNRVPGARFIQADLGDIQQLNGTSYDLVVALEVLEHIDADLEVLAKLDSGARFVGSVPNFDSFGHVRFFQDGEAVKARYADHIRDLEVTPFQLAPNSILFLMSGVLA